MDLGQGDPWDAQKDMLAGTLGAVFALALFTARERSEGKKGSCAARVKTREQLA